MGRYPRPRKTLGIRPKGSRNKINHLKDPEKVPLKKIINGKLMSTISTQTYSLCSCPPITTHTSTGDDDHEHCFHDEHDYTCSTETVKIERTEEDEEEQYVLI